ncbi:glycosyltransferase family 2 protein [Bariatricus sp. SGI.019]|uniref:glycosyltransferase family 2 protein n=1 Tax=Bariatricus sp. SGI.019 TaxID=3420548 RepID=UPI003D08FADF
MDVTIVIPTKNAGSLFDKVLKVIFEQETTYTFEVVCVDSGSSDQTVDIIKKYPCKLYQIPASEFGHGKTRVFGASKGTGEYIIFITQDALPASKKWLQNFIDAMNSDKEIVGGFGIHYTYPDCNIIDKRDLYYHFKNFGEDNTIFQLTDENRERYKNEEGYRHFMVFFSDNNSCVRRDVFEKYPYKDVDFAEDQIWAREMIERGYKKLYCPFAPVYHSHNFKLSEYFKRYYDEYKGLYRLHKFLISSSWFKVPFQIVKHDLDDARYIKNQNISKKEKLYWVWYSLCRNFSRYVGGYLGGKYAGYSRKKQVWLDRHISQQYEQRNA